MSDPTTGFDPFQVDFSDHNLNVTTETASFLKKVSQVVYYPTWFNRDVQIWREENRLIIMNEITGYWVKRHKLTFFAFAIWSPLLLMWSGERLKFLEIFMSFFPRFLRISPFGINIRGKQIFSSLHLARFFLLLQLWAKSARKPFPVKKPPCWLFLKNVMC